MSSISFFTNETVSLEKRIDLPNKLQISNENVDSYYELNRCADWITSNNFQKVCLQFPDHLLPNSSKVCLKLQELTNQTIYVLADTAYESCCIDYIAAAHINADAIIHFGPDCFSETAGNIPYLKVFEKHNLNVNIFKEEIQHVFSNKEIVILVDTKYLHQFDEIVQYFKEFSNVKIQRISENNNCKDVTVIYVGNDIKIVRNVALMNNANEMFWYNGKLEKYTLKSQLLKKRNFLIEKIKDSKTIGIIIGTLNVKNYIQIIDRIKKLIDLSLKKYYLISVGKPTVAKLANFPELDVYVAVTCSMTDLYDIRDFYKPVVTPYDVEIALNANKDENLQFSYDYNNLLKNKDILCGQEPGQTDVSLLTNSLRSFEQVNTSDSDTSDRQIALKPDGTIATNSNFGAGYLSERSWKGLEQKIGQSEPEIAQEGRSGIAQGYKNELDL